MSSVPCNTPVERSLFSPIISLWEYAAFGIGLQGVKQRVVFLEAATWADHLARYGVLVDNRFTIITLPADTPTPIAIYGAGHEQRESWYSRREYIEVQGLGPIGIARWVVAAFK